MDSLDKQPVADALTSAVEIQWSGILRAMVAEEQCGMVVLCNGRIAWAVSDNQTEDLPFFLEQIARVPKDRLREIVNQQNAPGKSKKLGPVLEAAGLITPDIFRECLLAHIRSALASILENPLLVAQTSKAAIAADGGLTFSLGDALGSDEKESAAAIAPTTSSVTEGVSRDCNGEILENLALLSGYMYSFIANISGKLLAFHEAEHAEEQEDSVFTTVADWISISLKTASTLGMGPTQVAFMEGAGQSLLVQATDSERKHFLAVAFNEEGRLGVVKAKIAGMIPTVQTFTEKR
ncbi:hypothetical protein A7E78_09660 [Syntrophotalea acetylenivorans]|uniref:Uncharacterized protein n=1 Tax=Syntrophotalea acetylenivorans TaxID=1842532 RepID=A0A1L3GQ50_9BACT|nr:hypothetical protein [Syntrophotalea acetylenivorans]APG28081.1 hypothetical protein A7E78_09660 [Syntrophotalea acetylenivorans]